MKVSFEGIGEQIISFAAENGVSAGLPVKLSANGTVAAASSGSRFIGVCISAEDGFAEVQTAGYIELEYSGTAPSVGYANFAADTDGKVKAASAGGEYLVLKVDSSAGTVGFIM